MRVRTLLTAGLATAALAAFAASASATVTIGSNLAGLPASNVPGNVDRTAVALGAGVTGQAPNGLTSPVNGTLISWQARTNNGMPIALRVLRPVGGITFTGAGTSVTADPGPGATGPIPTSLQINVGDFIGLNSPDQFIYAITAGWTAGAWYLPTLADGATSPATATEAGKELLVQATIEPTNTLALGKPKLNKNNGSATLAVTVPNAGTLTYAGSGVKATGPATTTVAGEITVKIKAKGKKRRALNDNGKVTLKPAITFTPTNGTAAVSSKKVKLKKN